MKKSFLLAVVLIILVLSTSVFSAEITFDPNTQNYDFSSEGVLNMWDVPEASGNSIRANPDFGWPSEVVIATWFAMVLKAHELNLDVVVGYDPSSFDIWYVAKPR